jgi:hypothetical protein
VRTLTTCHRDVTNNVRNILIWALPIRTRAWSNKKSIDIEWDTLMSEEYDELRQCISADITEVRCFRQLLVNSVIATVILDKEQGVIHWQETAF